MRTVIRLKSNTSTHYMKSIADAIVYAVAYINAREGDDDTLDDDVGALESIAGYLSDATPDELTALADASRRAVESELSQAAPRPEFVEGLESWMEDMFGEDWTGNERVL